MSEVIEDIPEEYIEEILEEDIGEISWTRKQNKIKEPIKPSEDHFFAIISINPDVHNGKNWLEYFQEKKETLFSSFKLRRAYPSMPILIYSTAKKGIIAISKVGTEEDTERLLKEEGFEKVDPEKATPLINYIKTGFVSKDELVEFKIVQRVPRNVTFPSKKKYEIFKSLFEN